MDGKQESGLIQQIRLGLETGVKVKVDPSPTRAEFLEEYENKKQGSKPSERSNRW